MKKKEIIQQNICWRGSPFLNNNNCYEKKILLNVNTFLVFLFFTGEAEDWDKIKTNKKILKWNKITSEISHCCSSIWDRVIVLVNVPAIVIYSFRQVFVVFDKLLESLNKTLYSIYMCRLFSYCCRC